MTFTVYDQDITHWITLKYLPREEEVPAYIDSNGAPVPARMWDMAHPVSLSQTPCDDTVFAEEDYMLPHKTTGNRREITCPDCKEWQIKYDPEIHRLVTWDLPGQTPMESYACGESFDKDNNLGATLPSNVHCPDCQRHTPWLQVLAHLMVAVNNRELLPDDIIEEAYILEDPKASLQILGNDVKYIMEEYLKQRGVEKWHPSTWS